MTHSPMKRAGESAGEALIALRDAAFGYDGEPIVAGIDLRIDPGEVVALLGPNGAGKSTLVRGLLGLVDHLGGEARLFGTPLADFHDRSQIGYVPQRHSLSAAVRATAREIVQVGRLPRRPWWRPGTRADAAIVDDALAAVGLADRADFEVAAFSGGQQRRVLIARALAQQPDLLVMDEPTAGVDAASQDVLADVLAALAAKGTSMLIVTHELEALRAAVTRVACVEEGGIAFDGSPAAYARDHAPHAGHGHPYVAPSVEPAVALPTPHPLRATREARF